MVGEVFFWFVFGGVLLSAVTFTCCCADVTKLSGKLQELSQVHIQQQVSSQWCQLMYSIYLFKIDPIGSLLTTI